MERLGCELWQFVPGPGLPRWLSGTESRLSTGDAAAKSLTPASGRCPGAGNGYPLQNSCLENPMDRGAWRATVHGVAESDMTELLSVRTPTPPPHTHMQMHTYPWASLGLCFAFYKAEAATLTTAPTLWTPLRVEFDEMVPVMALTGCVACRQCLVKSGCNYYHAHPKE